MPQGIKRKGDFIMNKKTIAIITEIIPMISAVTSYLLIISKFDSAIIRGVISVTMFFAFFGFAFFFIGRKLAKGSKAVRVLGVLDCITTLSVIGFYVVVILNFGL